MKSPKISFILGLVFLFAGALFMSKLFANSEVLIVGIICYLLGNILLIRYSYLLSKTLSKESNSEILEKITERLGKFRDDLLEVKNANKGDTSQLIKIESIENNFDNWVQSFHTSKALRVLQKKKTDIEYLEGLEAFNNRWRDVYQTIYQTLEKAFQAYSNQAQYADFKQVFPSFPRSLFDNKGFYAKIQFDKKNILYITLHATKMLFKDKMVPKFLIKWKTSNSEFDDSLEIGLMSLSSDIELHIEEETEELIINSKSKIGLTSTEPFDLRKGHNSLVQYILGVVEDIIIDFEKK